ncbi:hypothetical protein GCM10028818_28280 [Spirosoma horti]
MKHYLHLISFASLLLWLHLCSTGVHAQAPANLTTNVALTASVETDFAPSAFFSTTAQIVAAFNKGRRTEEIQLGLPVNSLGNLTLPANYATSSDNQRALYLINAERQARSGINYGAGAVLGKPLEGVETALDNTAQVHSDYLLANNLFTHTGAGGTTSTQRIEATYPTNCLQRNGLGQYTMGRSENIYYSCGGGATFAVEQAIFNWLYRDTGASWGHREAILIQNVDASGNTGYNDDRSPVGNEGFMGIGVTTGAPGSYTACGANAPRIVVLNIADPSANAACTFAVENTPLPVSLTYWAGRLEQNTVALEWRTAWEKDARYFLIERSTDVKNFEQLGQVKSFGNTSEKQTYTFTDETPVVGYNYYRLIQVDLDGRSETSRIISVRRGTSDQLNQLITYPNPLAANEPFRLTIQEGASADIRLVDLLGFDVPTKQWRVNNKEVAVQPQIALSTGLYSVLVNLNGEQHSAKLLIK